MNLANQIKDLTTYWDMTQEAGIVLTLAASGRVHLAFGHEQAELSPRISLRHQVVGFPHSDAIDAHQPDDVGPAGIVGIVLFQQVKQG